MRISDWSSDVCSSDLAGCATASARSNANGFAEDAPNAGARNGADIRDCVYQTLGQTFGSVSVDDRPSRVCEIEDIVTAGTHEERIYIQTVRRVADGRSEEHTSELQSLMRISYAVFCLNKKTHIQHQLVRTSKPNQSY